MSDALSQEQKSTIARWVADGASLSDVQKRINAEFGVSMTYMDVRFLVDDLNLVIQDKEPKTEDVNLAGPDATGAPEDNGTGDAFADGTDAADAPDGTGSVSIVINPVQQPGVALGGSVTFSDGKTGQWQLDSYGELGFIPPHANYQPTAPDVQQFQLLLKQELAKLGY